MTSLVAEVWFDLLGRAVKLDAVAVVDSSVVVDVDFVVLVVVAFVAVFVLILVVAVTSVVAR